MGDEIRADGVVPVQGERDFELGADAVDGADQHRIAQAERTEREEAAESAHIRQHFGAARAAHRFADEPFGAVQGVDIDPRRGIRAGIGSGIVVHRGFSLYIASSAASNSPRTWRSVTRNGTSVAAASSRVTVAAKSPSASTLISASPYSMMMPTSGGRRVSAPSASAALSTAAPYAASASASGRGRSV